MKNFYRSVLPVLFLFLLGCVNNTQTKDEVGSGSEKETKDRFFTIELKEKTKAKTSVTSTEKSYSVSITFADAIKEADYPLSEITDKVEYVKLETTPECFLVNPVILTITQEDIIINSKHKSIHQLYRFSRNGPFLNKIGRKGRGPGEYAWTDYCAVDEKNKCVYVNSYSPFQVLKYSFNGEFMGSSHVSKSAEHMVVVNDSLIATAFSIRSGNEPYSLVVCKCNGDTVYTKQNNIQFKRPDITTMVGDNFDKPFFNYGNEVFFKERYNDTVFSLLPNSLTPRFKTELGPYQIPQELVPERIGVKGTYKISAGFLRTRFDEDDNYIYIGVQTHGYGKGGSRPIPVFHHKDDGELFLLTGHDVSSKKNKGFVNDIDGTFSFWPDYVSPDGEMSAIISVLRVAKMQEYLKDKTVERLKATKPNPEVYKIIEEFNLNDNPIIAIIPKSKKK